MAGKNKGRQQNAGFFQTIRDVCVALINKGQFPWAIGGVLGFALIIKMPAAEAGKLVFKIVDAFEQHELFGYAGWFVTTGLWFWHARYQRRLAADEFLRMGEERDKSQTKASGQPKFPSSGGSK